MAEGGYGAGSAASRGGRPRRAAVPAGAAPGPDAFDRRSQHRHKRLALLNQAARVINERGYATASLEEVAHTLGISKAAVYYYFRNKQEILFECYQMSFDIWDAALAEARERGRNGRERVEIYNVTNGERFATYAIAGAPGRGETVR